MFNVEENEPQENAPQKDKNAFRDKQRRFLYGLVMMNLYACLDKDECSTYFQEPGNLKDDFKMILGWKNSKDDRPAGSSTEATSRGAYALYERFSKLKEDDAVRLQNLLEGRPSFVKFNGEDDARRIIQLYQEAYISVMVNFNDSVLLDKYLINLPPDDVQFEKNRNMALRGLALMHLYACNTKPDICSTILDDPQNLKTNLGNILRTGWKNSKEDRTGGRENPSFWSSYNFFLLVKKGKEAKKHQDAVHDRMMSEAIINFSSPEIGYNPTLEYTQVYVDVVKELEALFGSIKSKEELKELSTQLDQIRDDDFLVDLLEGTDEQESAEMHYTDPSTVALQDSPAKMHYDNEFGHLDQSEAHIQILSEAFGQDQAHPSFLLTCINAIASFIPEQVARAPDRP